MNQRLQHLNKILVVVALCLPYQLTVAASPSVLRCEAVFHETYSPIDIPGDLKIVTSLIQGRHKPTLHELESFNAKIYEDLQTHWQKRYAQKEMDPHGHKKDSLKLIEKLILALGLKDVAALEQEFTQGPYKDIKIYTDENVDPVTLKGDGNPNYRIINTALRTQKSLNTIEQMDPSTAEKIRKIDAVLASLPPVSGIVYRGTRLSSATIDKIIESGSYLEHAYSSNTIDIVDAYSFLQQATNSGDKRKVMMITQTKTGRFIPFGEFAKEEEVLIPRNTRLQLRHHFEYKDSEAPENNAVYLFFSED